MQRRDPPSEEGAHGAGGAAAVIAGQGREAAAPVRMPRRARERQRNFALGDQPEETNTGGFNKEAATGV